MSDEKQLHESENRRLYEEYHNQLNLARQSSYEQYDKSILFLSIGALGLSLSFLRDISSPSSIHYPILLLLSWYGFASSIVLTVISFIISQRAMERQMEIAEDYYLKGSDDAFGSKNFSDTTTMVLNLLTGILFIVSIFLTLIFVTLNLQ